MLDERLKDVQTTSALEFQPQSAGPKAISLRCAGCGSTVDMAFWQPVVRCSHCQHLVYPDRSLRNLLPLGWDCPECHKANDRLTNFCVHCGAGLASRCLQCEAPVTGPVCLRCGEHQAHLRQLQMRMADRATWVPIQRERVRAQMEYEKAQAPIQERPEAPAPAAPLTPREARWTRKQQERAQRAERRSRRRSGSGWGWWWMLPLGIYFLAQRMGGLSSIFTPPANAPANVLPSGLAGIWNAIPGLVTNLPATLNSLQSLKTNDLQYSVLFAVVLIGLASLPMLLYLVDRTVKRLFP
jgi:hypothetical protein